MPGPALRPGARRTAQQQLFFSLYFMMTGIHAAAHGGGHRHHARDSRRWRGAAGSRPDYYTPGRSLRPLLALRRHRLDLPVPAAVPARASTAGTEPEARMSHAPHHRPVRTYVTVFVALLVLTGAHRARRATQDFGWLNTPIALGDRAAQGDAGRHLLHGPALQHAAHEGRGRRRLLLAVHPVRPRR